MFARPPREAEWLSWLYVCLWTLFIYLSIPFVRPIVRYVGAAWGRELFTYLVIAVVVGAAASALAIVRKGGVPRAASLLWLLGTAGVLVAYTISLSRNPEEAVHFVQYGALGVLLYRALVHRIRDTGVYLLAGIAGTVLGMLDEAIQWITPDRHWGLGDIFINALAVCLVQIAIWRGIRPAIVARPPGPARIRQICRFGALAVAFLGLCFINTPERMSFYSSRLPGLAVLLGSAGTMVEYGYLFEDPEIGIFRSRLAPEALRRQDLDRGAEGAAVLDRYSDEDDYEEFLSIYTAITDPFLHEARVHLFRRDRYLSRAENEQELPKRQQYLAIAHWENRILEKYFPHVLGISSQVWTADLKAQVEREALLDGPYESAVSRNLLTAVAERQVVWLFLAMVVGLLLVGEIAGRRTANRP